MSPRPAGEIKHHRTAGSSRINSRARMMVERSPGPSRGGPLWRSKRWRAGPGRESPSSQDAADAWLDRRGADQYEVFEQTVRTASGGSLTLHTFKSAEMLN
jgi:hypothetical protein